MAESLATGPAVGRTSSGGFQSSATGHYDLRSASYRELADRGAAVAAALGELGVCPRDRVLILMPDGPGFVEAFVGAMQQGAVPLPVSPAVSASDLMVVTAEAGARLVVAVVDQVPGLAGLAVGPPVLVDGADGPWAAVLRLPG